MAGHTGFIGPDFGDLLACGNDGTITRIDFTSSTARPTAPPRRFPGPPGLPNNCVALGWDAEEDMIYQGISGGTGTVGVCRFCSGRRTHDVSSGASTPRARRAAWPSRAACWSWRATASAPFSGSTRTPEILALTARWASWGWPPGASLNPDLGDLACDPVTFHKDPATGKDQFMDAMWSRNGSNGNGVVALQFPAFTCGLPSNATVFRLPGSGMPLGATCFGAGGKVMDADGDGIPDCWETTRHRLRRRRRRRPAARASRSIPTVTASPTRRSARRPITRISSPRSTTWRAASRTPRR